jgi:hypothetical protein
MLRLTLDKLVDAEAQDPDDKSNSTGNNLEE